MQYKTLALGMIQSHPTLHRHLRRTRRLMPALDAHATDLRADHLSRIDRLTWSRPDLDPPSRTAVALEQALLDLQARLSAEATLLAHDP